jgi:Co/Zn/Cd efflux system component
MKKSTYSISKMDCPSEEQMVRMKLSGDGEIHSLSFDLQSRRLEVIHSGEHRSITRSLDELNFDTVLVSTEPLEEGLRAVTSREQRTLLWQVLAINLSFFFIEMAAGWIANSMGLVADSLDMLADSLVYGMSLYAVGGTLLRKKRIARMSGAFQLALAILGFVEVLRRFIGSEEIPSYLLMIGISVLALVGNAAGLYLLQRSQSKEAHMRASVICTSNDVIVNFGVIAAGVLVLLLKSSLPDLIIGVAVFGLVARGSFRILQLSR